MRRVALLATLLLTLVACEPQPTTETYSARRGRVLAEIARGAALPELEGLAARAEAYAKSLSGAPSEETRAGAQTAWRALRVAWRRCAPWLLASVAEGLYEERLDAAPDYERLAAIRVGGAELDAAGVAALGWPQKSLPAQGELLFAEGELSPRAWSLLQHASAEWAREAGALLELWAAPKGLAQALTQPDASAAFRDAKDAVDLLLRRAVTVVARLRDDDLAALAGGTRKGKPARFAEGFDRPAHHREEVIATLEGLARLYLGSGAEGSGEGLSALVAKKSARVDESFRAALGGALAEARKLPEDAVRAAAKEPSLGRPLYDLVTLLRAQLTTSIASQLDTSLGFTLADGD